MSASEYELLDEIGRSGLCTIYRARDMTFGREVALKVYSGIEPNRLFREAQLTAQLPHPGIVPVYSTGTLPDGRAYLAMRLLKGDTLARVLQGRTSPADDLPRLLAVFERVCRTVAFVHEYGVVHRNLKPSVVMIEAPDEVFVLGWSLARFVEEPDSSSIAGTPAYLPPEQARGAGADSRSDVFGLGGILCAVLTGESVFTGVSVMDIVQRSAASDLSEAFERLEACGAATQLVALAKRCLAPKAANRPTASAVADAISEHLQRAKR